MRHPIKEKVQNVHRADESPIVCLGSDNRHWGLKTFVFNHHGHPRAQFSTSVHGSIIAIVDKDEGRSVTNGGRRPAHGPYWYAYWKEDGRTRSQYIGKELPNS